MDGYLGAGDLFRLNSGAMDTPQFQSFFPRCQLTPFRIVIRSFSCLAMFAFFVGCDAPLGEFEPNELHALVLSTSRRVESPQSLPDTVEVVRTLFGTPSEPNWPTEHLGDAATLIDTVNLQRAAGLVRSEKDGTHFGLMVEHCATCHGVAGDGKGPAAMVQNPYPRDFRAGIFKWKSTQRASKPTRADISNILDRGIPGTSMPSFHRLAESDREALADYVIFLSIRGEVERRLLNATIDELGYDDSGVASEDKLGFANAHDVIQDVLGRVTQQWVAAVDDVVAVPNETPNGADSIARGKEIFHGRVANCAGCHGPGGNGQAVTIDYDDWTKEYTTRLELTPTDRESIKPYRNAGALRPRPSMPRRLTDGVFRGGSDFETLYRRITQGIAGTPMPGVSVSNEESLTGLTESQVWDLVHYVLSLSHSDAE